VSPDWIAFVSDNDNQELICIIKPDGNGQECVTAPPHKNTLSQLVARQHESDFLL